MVTEEPLSVPGKLLAILRSDPLVNGTLAVGITVGFFHGWLKLEYNTPATVFLFDALLLIALGLAYLRLKKHENLIPSGPIGRALKAFYVLCAVILLVPGTPPLIIGIAAARGWIFASLMYCLGYHLTKSLPQARGYFYVLILLGLITSIYGLRQTPEEIQQRMLEDPEFEERYRFTYYAGKEGKLELRIFSTFISSGAFGGTMAYVAIFAIVLLSDPRTSRTERLLLAMVLAPIAYALVRSGARSALMSLIFGFLVIAWHRRNFFNWVLVPAVIVAVLKLAAVATGGSAADRFATLLKFDEIYYRNSIPTQIGWEYMMDGHLLGGGVGRSGHSVPGFLSAKLGYSDYKSADGDLGRLMIDMGVLGLVFFGRLLYVVLREALRALKKLQGTPVSTVALASAACIVMAVAALPSGSPFLGIPMGAMVWFFLGTLMKLHDGHLAGQFQPQAEAAGKPGGTPSKHFLHRPTRVRRSAR
jgi:hypothetical protein